MTTGAGKRKAEAAKAHHEDGDYEAAIESYTAAAYEYLGANGLRHAVSAARGLRYLLVAATCLRYTNEHSRCENICWQGIYISEMIAEEALALPRESNPYDQSVRGVWFEFSGDFRTVGGLPQADTAFDRAESVYVDAGDPKTSAFEQFHMAAAVMPKLVFRGTDANSDELDAVLGHEPTLTDWIALKRQQLPEALSRLDEADDWTYVF